MRQVRIGRHPNNTTRVVLDATGVSSYSVYPLYSPYRLVIDCVRDSGDGGAGPPHQLAPLPCTGRTASDVDDRAAVPMPRSRSRGIAMRRCPRRLSRARRRLRRARDAATPLGVPTGAAGGRGRRRAGDAPTPLPRSRCAAVAPPPPPRPTRRRRQNLAGGFSIARQLGLGVSRIVIDPGHGGHDPGATGKGVTEAELVLDVALRLEKLLAEDAGRRSDPDAPHRRVRPAAGAHRDRQPRGADLFLSIHANASPNAQARGVETYFLNFANNLSAAAVAARENAASGQAMGALPDFVKAIALNNKLDESRDFATPSSGRWSSGCASRTRRVKDLGVKQAPFVVLIGAAMPSVLAEISFLTNAAGSRSC